MKAKTAFLFPGQASQYVGMAKDLYDYSPQVQKLYSQAREVLGIDLAKASFSGPEELLQKTQYTQPAVFVHSVALLTILGDSIPKPDYVAGHSLGEYSALVCAKALTFEDALFAVGKRSQLMQKACDENPGTMAAIIGADQEETFSICYEASASGIIQPANFNSREQVAVSGEVKAVEKAVEIAKARGKKAMLLKVGGAFHSPLMLSAKSGMREELSKIKFNPAEIPVVTNVTGKETKEPEHLLELLVEQITKPVLWTQTLQFILNQGVSTFIEIGPGRVLQGLVKRTLAGVNISGLDKLADVEALQKTTVK